MMMRIGEDGTYSPRNDLSLFDVEEETERRSD